MMLTRLSSFNQYLRGVESMITLHDVPYIMQRQVVLPVEPSDGLTVSLPASVLVHRRHTCPRSQ